MYSVSLHLSNLLDINDLNVTFVQVLTLIFVFSSRVRGEFKQSTSDCEVIESYPLLPTLDRPQNPPCFLPRT